MEIWDSPFSLKPHQAPNNTNNCCVGRHAHCIQTDASNWLKCMELIVTKITVFLNI